MEDEVEKTRYKKLLEIRNNYIKHLAQQGCSSEAIALLFSLSNSYINILAKDYLSANPHLYSTEALFNKREETIQKLKQHNYSDEDISVIFFKGSLEKAETAKLDIDLREQNSSLELENKKLLKELSSYKLAYKELSEQKAKLDTNTHVLTDKLTLLDKANTALANKYSLSEQKNSALETDLILSQHDNKKLQEEMTALKLELENLQSLKDLNTNLNQQIKSLESKLNEINNERNRLELVNQTLMNENSEIEQQFSSTTLYLYSEISEKLSIIKSLEAEIQSLKLNIENLSTSEIAHEKVKSKFERVYTDEQREQMIEIYFRNHCKRKQSLEAVRSELNISISDKHFVRLLQEAGVFKATYRKRKVKK